MGVSFGEVVLGLLVIPRVGCEGDYFSLNVVPFLVYRYAAPGVFCYPVCDSFFGDVVVFLRVVFLSVHCLACPGACVSFLGRLLLLTVHGSLLVFGGSVALFSFFLKSLLLPSLGCEGKHACLGPSVGFCASLVLGF